MDMYTREYTEVVEVAAVACAAWDRDDNNKYYSFIFLHKIVFITYRYDVINIISPLTELKQKSLCSCFIISLGLQLQ